MWPDEAEAGRKAKARKMARYEASCASCDCADCQCVNGECLTQPAAEESQFECINGRCYLKSRKQPAKPQTAVPVQAWNAFAAAVPQTYGELYQQAPQFVVIVGEVEIPETDLPVCQEVQLASLSPGAYEVFTDDAGVKRIRGM